MWGSKFSSTRLPKHVMVLLRARCRALGIRTKSPSRPPPPAPPPPPPHPTPSYFRHFDSLLPILWLSVLELCTLTCNILWRLCEPRDCREQVLQEIIWWLSLWKRCTVWAAQHNVPLFPMGDKPPEPYLSCAFLLLSCISWAP